MSRNTYIIYCDSTSFSSILSSISPIISRIQDISRKYFLSNWEICRFLFLVFSPFRPAGDQRIPLDRSRCQTHLHPRACGSLLFFLFSVSWVLCRFRPAGDQRIPLDRSRCQTHLHPRACGSLFHLESKIDQISSFYGFPVCLFIKKLRLLWNFIC